MGSSANTINKTCVSRLMKFEDREIRRFWNSNGLGQKTKCEVSRVSARKTKNQSRILLQTMPYDLFHTQLLFLFQSSNNLKKKLKMIRNVI